MLKEGVVHEQFSVGHHRVPFERRMIPKLEFKAGIWGDGNGELGVPFGLVGAATKFSLFRRRFLVHAHLHVQVGLRVQQFQSGMAVRAGIQPTAVDGDGQPGKMLRPRRFSGRNGPVDRANRRRRRHRYAIFSIPDDTC